MNWTTELIEFRNACENYQAGACNGDNVYIDCQWCYGDHQAMMAMIDNTVYGGIPDDCTRAGAMAQEFYDELRQEFE